MKVFLSSTCYDIKDLRSEIETYLTDKGFETLLSDRADFPINLDLHRHDVCIENVKLCDLFIAVIDRRFGAPFYKNKEISISWAEFREAILQAKKIIVFVRNEIFTERQTYNHNKEKYGLDIYPAFVDNSKTYEFLNEIQTHDNGVWIQPFSDSIEIKKTMDKMYSTKSSLIYNVPLKGSFDFNNNIDLSSLSDSTSSFITKISGNDSVKSVPMNTVQLALNKLPDEPQNYLVESFEPLPKNDDEYIYFYPIKPIDDDGAMLYKLSTTALGRSVRSELLKILESSDSKKKNSEKKL